ncbi:TPA: hypothetical protein ACUJAJ_001368 [Klebsiella pneumoniae]
MQRGITIFAICNNANSGQKKTCASAQAGVSKVVNVTLTPPINTSGIARISTGSANKPANIRNSASQSVSKGLYFPAPVSITDRVNVNRSPIARAESHLRHSFAAAP